MALWLVRAGKLGQHENKFLTEGRIYLTWNDLNMDLSSFAGREDLFREIKARYMDQKPNTLRNWLSQFWPITREMQVGDWVVLPSKQQSAIHFGKITGNYQFDKSAPNPYYHFRTVDWFATNIPRSNFDQDLLFSFGAFLTICRISRNNAEERIKQMAQNHWKSDVPKPTSTTDAGLEQPLFEEQTDLEQLANDQLAKFLIRKYKGHGMAILIEAILKAKGYTTYRSPEGADKGVDLLAAPEPMGFGRPRICVQVKTSDTPVDRPTLDQLIGAMQNFHADQGLLVSWSGFKSSVERELPSQFFKVRLWGQKEIIHELLSSYDKLDDDLKAELPLKKIWTLTFTTEEQ